MPIFKSIKPGKSISKIIDYVSKEARKNNSDDLCCGINIDKNHQLAKQQMNLTKELWNKKSGRQYQHYVLSFAPNDKISPKDALDYAKKHAEKCFGDFEVFLAVHQESEGKKLHVHYVVNSVSFKNGKKIQTSKNDYERFKQLNDQLAKEYGLNVIDRSKEAVKNRGRPQFYSKKEYQQFKNNIQNSIYVKCALVIKKALDKKPDSFSEFQKIIELYGWQAKLRGSTLTFVDLKTGRKIRANTLAKKLNTMELRLDNILQKCNCKMLSNVTDSSIKIKEVTGKLLSKAVYRDERLNKKAGIRIKLRDLEYER